MSDLFTPESITFTAIKFIMGIACAGIGLALYPILKKYHEGLAIGAAGFRPADTTHHEEKAKC